MKYILTVEEREIINYIDSIVSVNEGFDSIVDKCNRVVNKIKNLSTDSKRKVLIYFVTSLLTIASADKIIDAFHNTKDPVAIEVVDNRFKLHDPIHMHTSHKGLKNIKVEEGKPGTNGIPVLKAYKIGDGKITLGWGHAENPKHSKFRVGQAISLKIAQQLFKSDVKFVENSIRNMFKDWKEEGIDVKITQDQFDVMVSMGFNMGPTGLRKTQFIKHLKQGELEKAGKSILHANVDKDFPGLVKRRLREARVFLSFLEKES